MPITGYCLVDAPVSSVCGVIIRVAGIRQEDEEKGELFYTMFTVAYLIHHVIDFL